tara:strand:- start:211 stop:1179 length:969 start_codon:yes stop_codon:yes gene_type:complete
MELQQPFLKLPWQFDAQRLASEVEALSERYWLDHPSGLPGNSAVPLVSVDGAMNHAFDGAMKPTEALMKSHYIHQAIASFGEVVARSRLMRLAPGAQVAEHVDFNYHWVSRVRIHIPIITNPQVNFYCGDESVHMAQGESWLFDSWRRHRVVNASDSARTHLVIDLAGSSRFWRIVRKADSLDNIVILPNDHNQPRVKTEQFPVAPVMAPGEMLAIVEQVLEDCESNPDNDSEMMLRYRHLLLDLVHDWREVWGLYGFNDGAFDRYRHILDRTAGQLAPQPRVLVTASNNVGINPIINQRILAAALRPRRVAEFSSGCNPEV